MTKKQELSPFIFILDFILDFFQYVVKSIHTGSNIYRQSHNQCMHCIIVRWVDHKALFCCSHAAISSSLSTDNVATHAHVWLIELYFQSQFHLPATGKSNSLRFKNKCLNVLFIAFFKKKKKDTVISVFFIFLYIICRVWVAPSSSATPLIVSAQIKWRLWSAHMLWLRPDHSWLIRLVLNLILIS